MTGSVLFTATAVPAAATDLRRRFVGAPAPAARRARPGDGWWSWALAPLSVVLTLVAILGVGESYRLSGTGAAPSLYYGVFWLTLAPVWVCLAVAAVTRRPGWRPYHLALLTVVSWFPKYLRNPSFSLYHDEIAHERAVRDLLADGQFFRPNALIPVIGEFPGLHDLTATLSGLTGLTPFVGGVLVILVAHLVTLASVSSIPRSLFGSRRAGAVAAIVYATNPNVLYFDNQFSYESVGITLFVATIALAAMAERRLREGRKPGQPGWRSWAACSVAAAAALLVTHALSSLFLLLVLLLILAVNIVARVRGGHGTRSAARVWATVLLGTLALAVLWMTLVAKDTIAYLAPYPLKAAAQLSQAAHGGGGTRQLFSGSVQPAYEHDLSYVAQLFLGAVALALVVLCWRGRRAWRRHATVTALFGLTLVYFPSVLFIFAPKGAEGARRSWAFIYVGVAVIVGLLVELVARRRRGRTRAWRRPVAAALAVVVLLIGNVSAGLNDPYRFPGLFRYGSDARDRTGEIRALTAGMAGFTDAGTKVATDRYTAMGLLRGTRIDPGVFSPGFPGWKLFMDNSDPSPELRGMFQNGRYSYAVVDARSGYLTPLAGWYFDGGAGAAGDAQPLPRAALARFDSVPWATCVFRTDHYAVYRLDFTKVGAK